MASSIRAHELQTAIYGLLSGAGLSAPVYDAPPDDAPHPYVEIAEWRSPPAFGKAARGHREITWTIDVWSAARGWKEAQDLADGVYAALLDNALVIPDSGVDVCAIRPGDLRAFLETDISRRPLRKIEIDFVITLIME